LHNGTIQTSCSVILPILAFLDIYALDEKVNLFDATVKIKVT
jgi:hypothetical protein